MRKDKGFSEVRIKQIREEPLYSDVSIDSPEKAVAVINEIISEYDREVFGVINLDTKNRPLNFNIVSMGSLSGASVTGRETLKSTLLSNASGVILFHNHPSGVLTPSQEDIALTGRLTTLFGYANIAVLDHVIVGDGSNYYSMMQNKELPVVNIKNSTNVEDISFAQVAEDPTDYKSDRQEEMDRIMEQLEEGVRDVFSSDKFKTYLETMSKFPTYSVNNQMLIFLQNPNATKVCGFNKWKKDFNRHVKKGEKGLRILAPETYKVNIDAPVMDKNGFAVLDEAGNPATKKETIERKRFKAVSVFDLSQTAGEPLPEYIQELKGDVEEYAVLFKAITDVSPVDITFEEIKDGSKGFYSVTNDFIVINSGMSEVQNIKTALHEIAHATLHNIEVDGASDKDANTKEVAEAVAFIVCRHFGIDTSDYSFGYVGGWSSGKDLKELRSSLETIRKTASDLVDLIETRFAELKTEPELMENLDAAQITEKSIGYTYRFMQLSNDRLTRINKFESFETNERLGIPFNADDYDEVYAGEVFAENDLSACEQLYSIFNINRPADYEGSSMSVSDVIVLEKPGETSVYYCNNIGFVKLTGFFEPVPDKDNLLLYTSVTKDKETNTKYFLLEKDADSYRYEVFDEKFTTSIKTGTIKNQFLNIYEASVEALEAEGILISSEWLWLNTALLEDHMEKINALRETVPEKEDERDDNRQMSLFGGEWSIDKQVTEPEEKPEAKEEEAEKEKKKKRKSRSKDKIEDFGEKIGGARKDLWKERGLTNDDIEWMNDAERNSYIKKENIWIKPNYQEMFDSGIPREVCYFIKTVRDAIPTKPVMEYLPPEDEQIRYINFVTEVREAFMAAKTIEDTKKLSTFFEDNGYYDIQSHVYFPTVKAGAYITRKLDKALGRGGKAGVLGREVKKKNFLMTEDEILIKNYDFIRFDPESMSIDEYGEGGQRISAKEEGWGTTYYYTNANQPFVDLDNLKADEWFITKRNHIEATGFVSVESAREFALAIEKSQAVDKDIPDKKKRKTALKPIQLENVERIGGTDYRGERHATGEDYLNDFGFRGGEFGNWTNQLDRQTNLDMGYDAFRDLALALNIDEKDVAMNGNLSIAFGARGHGNALAHYEPLREVINLTKMKGAGSLGHEWIHALDDHIGKAIGLTGDSTFLSENIGFPNSNKIPDSFNALMNTIKRKTLTGNEKIEEYKRKAETKCRDFKAGLIAISRSFSSDEPELVKKQERLMDDVIEEAKKSYDYKFCTRTPNGRIKEDNTSSIAFSDFIFFQQNHGDNNPADIRNRKWANSMRESIGEMYDKIDNHPEKIRDIVVKTKFLSDAQEIDSNYSRSGHGYWSSSCELLARAGAAYIKDKCEEIGIRNDYLSGHADRPALKDGEKQYYTSPQGEERKSINEAFDKFFDELRMLNIIKENPEHTKAAVGKEDYVKTANDRNLSVPDDKEIRFYVAECSEFPDMGYFKDGIASLTDALQEFVPLLSDNANMLPSLGVKITSDNELFGEQSIDLMVGRGINLNGLYDMQRYLPDDIKPLDNIKICNTIHELLKIGHAPMHDYRVMFIDQGYAKAEMVYTCCPEVASAHVKDKYKGCTIKDVIDIATLNETRTVAITAGMSEDTMIIKTDAPKGEIEKWCERYNRMIEDGRTEEPELFASLKDDYKVEKIYFSDVDDMDPMDVRDMVRDADEVYDLFDHMPERNESIDESHLDGEKVCFELPIPDNELPGYMDQPELEKKYDQKIG